MSNTVCMYIVYTHICICLYIYVYIHIFTYVCSTYCEYIFVQNEEECFATRGEGLIPAVCILYVCMLYIREYICIQSSTGVPRAEGLFYLRLLF